MRNPYRQLEKTIGYRFKNRALLEVALTHPSFRYEMEEVTDDNQRLEFLGDAALGLVSAAYLYSYHPDFPEGELTKLRSRLSSRQALADVAEKIELGAYLRLGKGERKSGGHVRASNRADALEAVLGAAYLDGKMKAVEKIFDRIFACKHEGSDIDCWRDNPKGALQEVCQQQDYGTPMYRLTEERGPAHQREYVVEVVVRKKVLGCGTGCNKRLAEQAAALEAMESLTRPGDGTAASEREAAD